MLFVDMRGYTSFSESRRAEEIFSTVNRYTETVSEIVRQHGGIGGRVQRRRHDGRLRCAAGAAAQGARGGGGGPRDRRRRRGAAGAEPHGHGAKLSVGVGIATGEAFVGNIRAADRMIWSAIGNTTNLAARLQCLTRELDAALVIDAATWQALGEAGRDFIRHDAVAIRGRDQGQDLFCLRAGTGAPRRVPTPREG